MQQGPLLKTQELSVSYNCSRAPKPTDPWEIGKAVTYMDQTQEGWPSLTSEWKYEYL